MALAKSLWLERSTTRQTTNSDTTSNEARQNILLIPHSQLRGDSWATNGADFQSVGIDGTRNDIQVIERLLHH